MFFCGKLYSVDNLKKILNTCISQCLGLQHNNSCATDNSSWQLSYVAFYSLMSVAAAVCDEH